MAAWRMSPGRVKRGRSLRSRSVPSARESWANSTSFHQKRRVAALVLALNQRYAAWARLGVQAIAGRLVQSRSSFSVAVPHWLATSAPVRGPPATERRNISSAPRRSRSSTVTLPRAILGRGSPLRYNAA